MFKLTINISKCFLPQIVLYLCHFPLNKGGRSQRPVMLYTGMMYQTCYKDITKTSMVSSVLKVNKGSAPHTDVLIRCTQPQIWC